MGRPTTEDKQLKTLFFQTMVALLIAFALLVVTYLWLFKKLLN